MKLTILFMVLAEPRAKLFNKIPPQRLAKSLVGERSLLVLPQSWELKNMFFFPPWRCMARLRE